MAQRLRPRARGVVRARVARGEWLLWLDADDELVVEGRLEDVVDDGAGDGGAVAAY